MNGERLIDCAQFIALARRYSWLQQACLLCTVLNRCRAYGVAGQGRLLPAAATDTVILPQGTNHWPWTRRILWPDQPQERTWQFWNESTSPLQPRLIA